jgi:hypothetical protein
MALMFGMNRPDGMVQITEIQYQKDSDPRGGYQVDAANIPDYPTPKLGVGYTMLYNPDTKEFVFEESYRPHTKEEAILEVAAAIRELAQAVKEM